MNYLSSQDKEELGKLAATSHPTYLMVVKAAAIQSLLKELEDVKAQKKDLYRVSIGEVWHWQGDEEDHLESLTCPILIRPEQLRTALAAAEAERDKLRNCSINLVADYEASIALGNFRAGYTPKWASVNKLKETLAEAALKSGVQE